MFSLLSPWGLCLPDGRTNPTTDSGSYWRIEFWCESAPVHLYTGAQWNGSNDTAAGWLLSQWAHGKLMTPTTAYLLPSNTREACKALPSDNSAWLLGFLSWNSIASGQINAHPYRREEEVPDKATANCFLTACAQQRKAAFSIIEFTYQASNNCS